MPQDKAASPQADARKSGRTPMRSVGELFAFVLTGAKAIMEFWLPKRPSAPRPDLEPVDPEPDDAGHKSPSERVAAAVKKIAPYPVQDG